MKKLTVFRRKYLRPIYLPLFDVVHGNFLYLSRIKLARTISRDFNSATTKKSNATIVITYDHGSSPPTYGDYFIILMIARFISMSQYKVRFVILDSLRVGNVWNAMTIESQDLFVLDQIKLAYEFLDDSCEIIIEGKFDFESRTNDEMNSNRILVHSGGFYQWAPYFLHLLIEKHNWLIPDGFLLEAKKQEPEFRYVAWNVRKSIWANYRDTDSESLNRDFREIRSLYPEHSIVILSNQKGIDFAFKELESNDQDFSKLFTQGRILAQPDFGFPGAINWVLNSDFYFQRSGGGMGVIAIFSSVPYVMYSIERTSFFGHYRNRKIAPWSAENQIFRRLFLNKKSFLISKSL